MFAVADRRSHVAKDAGSIFVDVRWVSCLREAFLTIHLDSPGAHLLAMDAGDTSDPYVKVTFVTNILPIKATSAQNRRSRRSIRCGTSRFTWGATSCRSVIVR